MTATYVPTISIAPGQLGVTLDLRGNSALSGCTTIDGSGDGAIVLVRRWPSLSTGEELLWSVAAWLNGRGDLPDAETLRAHLDVGNLAAVVAVTEGLVTR